MDESIRFHPWELTPLGPREHWPPQLTTLVGLMLGSNQPMFVAWGPERTLIYNDFYAHVLGNKHPTALGRDFLEVWHEIRDDLMPIVAAAYRGEPVQMDRIHLQMQRHGYLEDAQFSFFYSPVCDEVGKVAGFFCACSDITAHVSAERRLAEREARYRGVLAGMNEAFILVDRRLCALDVNARAEGLLGLTRDQILGHDLRTLFLEPSKSVLASLLEQALGERRSIAVQHLLTVAEGQRWFDIHVHPVDEGLALMIRDVTERHRIVEEAALASERVQLALDAGAIIGTWVWSIPDNRFIADERFAASFDIDPELCRRGLPIERIAESIHPDDRERVMAQVAKAIDRGGAYRCEYRVRSQPDGYRWIEANGRVELDEQGRPSRFPGVLLDIELRRRTESERDRATALLTTFIEAVPGVVFAKDREGRYLIANRGTAEAFGLRPDEFIGRTDAELLADPKEAERLAAIDRRIMTSGQGEQVEESVPRADGSSAVWWSTKAPLFNAAGEIVGIVGSSVEITDRKRMEDALRLADRRKDEFLAMLAHELRNPLAPISGAAQLLGRAASDPARVQQLASIITRQVGHMSELVDDLLDVSRVTRGLVELDRVPVDVRAVVAAAIEQVAPVLQARQHLLTTEQKPGPVTVLGDRHRLVQVVSNLLNNAAKYTPQGGHIKVSLATSEASAELRVSDNGNGIEPDLLPHIFELFTQAERTPDRSQGGLGIGLSLVHSIAQLHGGEATAFSAGPGRGSTFAITLPLIATQSRPERRATADWGLDEPRDILVVDDNADAATTLADLLRMLGHRVDVACDGAEAIQRAQGRTHWDAFVLDIGLPDMTGYELAEHLRSLVKDSAPLFIALTGYGRDQDRILSQSAGFRHHLVKPVDFERMREILRSR